MLDEAAADELRRHWDEGWNGYDLDTIMAPFAADVVFTSPFVPKRTGDPDADGDRGLRRAARLRGRRAAGGAGHPVHASTPCTRGSTASSSCTRATSPTGPTNPGPTRCASTATARWSSGDATTRSRS